MISFLDWTVSKKFFRNANHALWFLMSFWILVLIILYYFYPDLPVIIIPLAIHLVALIQSVLAIISKRPSETLSKDCIWFNTLMILVYSVIYFTFLN